MARLRLSKSEYEELEGVVNAMKTHRSRLDSDLIRSFCANAREIQRTHESELEQFEFVAGHPHSNGSPRVNIRLHASVEIDDGIINVNARLTELPNDVCQAEAIVRAVIKELKDNGVTRFEVYGHPGSEAGISGCLHT